MSRQSENDKTNPDSARPSGLSNMLRGLTSAKSTRPPPRIPSPAAAQPRTEFVNVTPMQPHGLAANHMDALDSLRTGTSAERVSAANTLRHAISEYPLNPVLDIWYAAKDLIDESKPPAVRMAGWELLTECVKHTSSTDLERQEYFQTITAPANPDDFHLQLAALVDLTNGGRRLAGFDYETIPLLIAWLHQAYDATRSARKNAAHSRGSKSSKKQATFGQDKDLTQLFSFIHDVMKFGYNTAGEATVSSLIDMVLHICMSTSVEVDLKSCISIIDVIVTFGSIPSEKLKACVQVLGSIYCLVPGLQKSSWHTLSNLLKSHNGQATVRILLDILRNLSADSYNDRDVSREIRGALAVLQKLLAKSSDKGYPTVPYALLIDGLSNILKTTNSIRVYGSIVQLINALFDDGHGQIHRLIVDEDWSGALRVCIDSYKRVVAIGEKSAKEETAEEILISELTVLIRRLDDLMAEKNSNYIPRQAIVNFLTQVPELLPDNTARTVLNYFQEFRCCSPSDLDWEENVSLVLDAFFLKRNRPSSTRLSALSTIMDAYDIVNLVGDGAEQNFIPRLTRQIIQDVTGESDIPVLDAIMAFIVSVAQSCDMDLFRHIMEKLEGITAKERLTSLALASTVTTASIEAEAGKNAISSESPSNTATRALVTMFLKLINFHKEKSITLFNILTGIASSSLGELDARLTSMKLLFRLRADWAYRVYVTTDLDTDFLATSLCRTETSMAKRRAEEMSDSLRFSRNDHGIPVRPSRGVSFSQGDRGIPTRAASSSSVKASAKYQPLWQYPDAKALPCAAPSATSPILVSHVHQGDPKQDLSPHRTSHALDISAWLDGVLAILRGANWEVYSFVLVHLPLQLSNHAIFQGALPQIQELRSVVCENLRTNALPEPPNIYGLRKADVAICLYQTLTTILSYHEYFQKADEDEIVKTFAQGISGWERSAKACIHALSICCHELPLSMCKSLVQILTQMAQIITQPHVSVHVLEFLSCLSRMHNVYVNFREEEFRTVFGICFRYLDYAREKRQSNRSSKVSELSNPATPQSTHQEHGQILPSLPSDNLPQYVHAIAYHAIIFWFLALKLPDRANHVSWIVKKLFTDVDGPAQQIEEQAITSVDFMQRVTYADADESAKDPYFTEDRFGQIGKKRWLIGNSIVTVKQGTLTGWAHIVKRQPSGTSAFTIREAYKPPPLHQIENHLDVTRDGQATSHAILPNHILVQLLSPMPQGFDASRPIALPDDDAVDRAIRVFDRSSSLDGHKVGVVYIGEGQTEEADILANVSGSSDYIEFLSNLGTLTRLKGANFNTQGLDREYDTDGEYTFCWRDRVTEIVFHVTTQMPTNLERDPLCTLKKRHIGNDFVNIIFNDSGNCFQFDTFPSQFNFVNIVITPASRASFVVRREAKPESEVSQPFYMVKVMSKPGFPPISPASETKMVSLKALPGFIRLLALNATMFAMVWHSQEGGEHISSWTSRLREINRLRERYGGKTTPVVSLLHSSSPYHGAGAPAQGDSSRSAGSVRDSLNSLRRASVANLFASPGELISHRSSILSTSTTTNETETGTTANSICSVVDTVDFTKWAS